MRYDKQVPVIALLLALFPVLIYSGTLSNGFVFDDRAVVLENQLIRGGLSDLRHAFTGHVWSFDGGLSRSDYFRPLLHVSYFFIYNIFGLAAWGWHLTSALMHAANTALVFLIARELFGRVEGVSIAYPAAAALLFAAHPANAESVAWVSCLTELGYAFFSLLSFYLYIKAKGSARALYAASVFFFFISTLYKEPAIVLPLVLLVYDLANKRAVSIKGVTRYLPFAAAAALYLVMRSAALSGASKPLHIHDAFFQALAALPVFSAYLYKLVLPYHLSAFITVEPPASFTGILVPLLAVAAFAGAVAFIGRRERSAYAYSALIFLPLLPTFYLLFQDPDAYNIAPMAERYLYLPSAGFALMAAAFARAFFKEEKRAAYAALAAAVIVTGLYAARTVARVPVWKDDLTLWEETVKDEPGNYFALFILGRHYEEAGDGARAESSYTESIRARPSFLGAHHSLGLLYYSRGELEAAAKEFSAVLQREPDNADALYNMAVILMDRGDYPGASERLAGALRGLSGNKAVRASNALAVSYARTGRIKEARQALERAQAIDPLDKETLENLKSLESGK